MYRKTFFDSFCLILLATGWCFTAQSQPNTTIELKKPDKFQSRQLASEKTGNKKFSIPKRLYNNTVSQYNYYFNANAKLESIISGAKANHREDYTQLLPFYNYSLEETAKGAIDSVIYKCTAGILLHDLRSDWVDRFYLLLGKAYLHRKDFDSAAVVLNYINYAYAPKDDGYDIPIGSNASNSNGIFTISSSEKRNFWKKISSKPPSRNESFLWQVRNYIEQKKLTEAEALLEIIRSDQLFPTRLKTDWYEMEAYLQYSKQANDSAAFYLIKALENAAGKTERSRWEYLAAQLLEQSRKDSAAINMYGQAIQHSRDPLLEIYARLRMVSLSAATKPNAIQENLNQLLSMARKDKYQGYRSIIYYAAAELELKQKNNAGAEKWLLKSIQCAGENDAEKQQSLLMLADISYAEKKYMDAAGYYDSIRVSLLKMPAQKTVNDRKIPLDSIAANIRLIRHEDSLQQIAALPMEARTNYLKTLLKKLRKAQGLKETEAETSYGGNLPAAPDDLFKPAGNDFYFSSSSLKAKGLSDFKARWGNRPNIDNWRRQTAIDRSFTTTPDVPEQPADAVVKAKAPEELSLTSLLANLPMDTLALQASDHKIREALLNNGYRFQFYLQNYPAAIETYAEIARRFPDLPASEELLFRLNDCYNKTGEYKKADSLIKAMSVQYPAGKFTKKLTAIPAKNKTVAAEQAYETVYHSFLEGNFERAKQQKMEADQQFGKNYWTPQLLYIESIYYTKLRQDSIAIDRLQNIIGLFPASDMVAKAATMVDVLKRRKEIESYLGNLDIERPIEYVARNVDLNPVGITKVELPKPDSITRPAAPKTVAPVNLPAMLPPTAVKAPETYQFVAADSQYVALLLNRVDPVYLSEGRNAFNRYHREQYYNQPIALSVIPLNDTAHLMLIGPFKNAADAMSYIDKTRPVTPSRILPWLSEDKYRYSMMSPANLELLRRKKEPAVYQKWLHQLFPDKF
ncbi:MAG TPA: tetratricopeptide repeat protein [Sediminibacterium sp.]|nr:tetratricopeptide repeat protein [Sediminibacterium sp.]